jgi:hypothetical protein
MSFIAKRLSLHGYVERKGRYAHPGIRSVKFGHMQDLGVARLSTRPALNSQFQIAAVHVVLSNLKDSRAIDRTIQVEVDAKLCHITRSRDVAQRPLLFKDCWFSWSWLFGCSSRPNGSNQRGAPRHGECWTSALASQHARAEAGKAAHNWVPEPRQTPFGSDLSRSQLRRGTKHVGFPL